MKKVLLVSAAALAVFGSAAFVSAEGRGGDVLKVQVPKYGLNDKGERVIVGWENEMTPAEAKDALGVETNGAIDRTVGEWKEDNSKPADIYDAEAANELRLAKQSIEKTEAGMNGKKMDNKKMDGKMMDGKKVLPKTSAIR